MHDLLRIGTLLVAVSCGTHSSTPPAPHNAARDNGPVCPSFESTSDPVPGFRAQAVVGEGHATSLNPGLNSTSTVYTIDAALSDAVALYDRCLGARTPSDRGGFVYVLPPRTGERGTAAIELYEQAGIARATVRCDGCY